MNVRDILELALQRFRTRAMRFLLTIFGVGIGIAVVFFLVSLGFGLQEVVIGRIATSESLVSLTVAVADEAVALLKITDSTLEDFRHIEHVKDVSPVLSVPGEISYQDLKGQTLAQAVSPSYFRYAGITADGGHLFDEAATDQIVVSTTVFRLFGLSQEEALNKEVFLTFFFPKGPAESSTPPPPSAEGTAPTPSPAGAAPSDVNITSLGHPFKIVGFVQSDTNSLYMPLRAFDSIPNHAYTQVKVRVDTIASVNPVRDALLSKGYVVVALTDTLDQLNQIFRFTQIGLAALGIVALFIASVGMFNTLTISLLERTREVGILKAVGATNRDVWMMFLFEALMIGLLGGLSGVGGGYIMSKVVNYGINILARRFGGQSVSIFHAPWWFVVTIVSVSFLVGAITGLYPARRAAHLNPLKALRHE